jgi:DNA topoisomerase I
MADAPKCPKCGSEMVLRKSYRGEFYGCSKFPNCRGTVNVEGGQKAEPEKTDEKCPKCGSPMQIKNGKRGRFLGCTKYPECRGTKDYKEKCPKCGSEMTKKSSAKGEFWGCVKYPECKGTRNISRVEDAGQGGKQGTVNAEDTTDYSKGGGDEVPF